MSKATSASLPTSTTPFVATAFKTGLSTVTFMIKPLPLYVPRTFVVPASTATIFPSTTVATRSLSVVYDISALFVVCPFSIAFTTGVIAVTESPIA